MSFLDLKASRSTKSYVKSSINRPVFSASGELVEHERDGQISAASEEGLYSSLAPSVEVRRSELSGRGIWTKLPIKAGSVIVVAKPYASALSSENLQTYCSSCFASSGSDGMKRCTKCRAAYYCDWTCQNNDWKIHKHECTSLQRWFQAAPSSDTLPPSDAVRCISRMLWRRQKNGPNSIQAKEIGNMQSHRTTVKPSAYETYAHLAHALVQYMNLTNPTELAEFGFSNAADLVDVISRFVTNTFTVTDPALTPLGAAVSPVIALINHSCNPNAVVVFPRTSVDPKAQEPMMQILTSYIDVTLPTNLRQQTLEETYNFRCICTLCTSKNESDPREAMNCPKDCGGRCPLPTDEHSLVQCFKCKSAVISVEATLDAVRVGQQGLDKATKLQMTDPVKSIQLTTNLIPILTSSGLQPSSHPLLGLIRLHQSLLTASFPDPLTQDHLDETIRTATKTVTGLATLLGQGHPVLALAVTELGKLLAVDEPSPRQTPGQTVAAYPPSGLPRLILARDTLLRARNMLLVGFGTVNEGGQVGQEVRSMIVSLEKEIDVFKQGVQNVLEDRPKIKAV